MVKPCTQSYLRRLTPQEHLILLESQLSNLMDSKYVVNWDVNPAYDPDVKAFIDRHANNSLFHQRALNLQKNRARYYAKVCLPLTVRKTIVVAVRHTTLDAATHLDHSRR